MKINKKGWEPIEIEKFFWGMVRLSNVLVIVRLGNQQCEIIVEFRFKLFVFAFDCLQKRVVLFLIVDPVMLLASASFFECVDACDFVWICLLHVLPAVKHMF